METDPKGATGGSRSRLHAWREWVRAHPVLRPWYRVGVALAGLVLVVGAALTGWLPGPGGIPLFLAGLALWATEFDWAHGLMVRCRRLLDRFLALPARRRRGLVAAMLLLVLLGWWAVAAHQGLPQWLPVEVRRLLAHLPLLEAE